MPVLTVEVDRSTMAPADVAAKFPRYRELFRVKVRDNDPALADRELVERTVHWWRRMVFRWSSLRSRGGQGDAVAVADRGQYEQAAAVGSAGPSQAFAVRRQSRAARGGAVVVLCHSSLTG
ncbi:hypothetical protein [Streptomyces sp. RP5T]|uniref:hypothetical protein n=1 Tax=Streptomyces sp. RP5T TaxID=2490848 RepID=UPI000F64587E|nr:hypothetical protein [Streptomyces sp. RP5T]RRR85970.1 hypothetical protein EHS43_06015 [Streptomyces sp. RP5T]